MDTAGSLFRIYYALPPLLNCDEVPTGLLTGFAKAVNMFSKNRIIRLKDMVWVLEGGGNFRDDLYSEYKNNRVETTEEFKNQFKIVLEWIEKMGFPTIKKANYEADDVIATLAKRYEEMDYKVFIISADKDFTQLVSENIKLIKPDKMSKIFALEDVEKNYKVTPSQFIDYQSLIGDPIDNVPGVKGIGKVWAAKLLNQFKTLDNLYAKLDEVSPAIRKKLETGKEDAFLSRELVTLKDDLELEMPKFKDIGKQPLVKIIEDLIKYDISSIVNELVKNKFFDKEYVDKLSPNGFTFKENLVLDRDNLEHILENIQDGTVVAFDTETTGLDPHRAEIVGISFAFDKSFGFYIPISHSFLGSDGQIPKDEIKSLLHHFTRFKLVGHNAKFDRHVIYSNFGINFDFFADTIILGWLKRPGNSVSLDNLSYYYLKHKKIKFKEIVEEGLDFSSVDFETACRYSVEDAVATLRLYQFFTKAENLKPKFLKLAFRIENKVSHIIGNMERFGIKIDLDYLLEVKKQFEEDIEKTKLEIFAEAKHELNLNSPKQIAEVLYEELKITSKVKKTEEKVLREIEHKHPIIGKILKYRELHKLLSTYVLPLQELEKDGRVKTSFLQTGTSTGRLSSRDPNLQNIPIDSNIRKAFVAEDGYSLLFLDYSQIELRLLAHLSGDEGLIEAFKQDEDVHTVVANKLGVSREIAKTVNYGLLYGMGSSKLAQTLDIDYKLAKDILENYFNLFPMFKEYSYYKAREILDIGYAKTILGRERYFFIDVNSFVSYAEYQRNLDTAYREAFNTLFQGSVADLIKTAMVKIYKEIQDKNIPARPLLQIHDELIFEVRDDVVSDVSKDFKKIMEKSLRLKVPLKVNTFIGKNWGDLTSTSLRERLD
jgi:DNA polymerase-1